jgi:hypothetical protein
MDDVHILGGSVQTRMEKHRSPSRKEIGLEVDADKTKYINMSRDQNAGRILNTKNGNNSSERVEHFKYLGTTQFHS